MSLELFAAYLLACLVIIIVPGPTVTLIIANSLRHGSRAGLLNMAGTQAGLAIMIAIVGIGLSSVIAAMGHWFDWVRLAGAAAAGKADAAVEQRAGDALAANALAYEEAGRRPVALVLRRGVR